MLGVLVLCLLDVVDGIVLCDDVVVVIYGVGLDVVIECSDDLLIIW